MRFAFAFAGINKQAELLMGMSCLLQIDNSTLLNAAFFGTNSSGTTKPPFIVSGLLGIGLRSADGTPADSIPPNSMHALLPLSSLYNTSQPLFCVEVRFSDLDLTPLHCCVLEASVGAIHPPDECAYHGPCMECMKSCTALAQECQQMIEWQEHDARFNFTRHT